MKRFAYIIIALLLMAQTAGAQCAMCRSTLESNVSDGTFLLTSDNLNTGIMYLFMSPYALVLAVALIWYFNARKNARTVSRRSYTQD